MDPELTKELQDELNVLVGLVSQQTAALTGMSESIHQITRTVNNAGSSVSQFNSAQRNNTDSVNRSNAGITALQQTHQKYREVTDQAINNLVSAGESGKLALTDFSRSILSGKEGFEKYNGVISKVGDASLSFGKSFGILGTAVGYFVKGVTMLLEYQTKQADALFKASDDIAKLGAAGTFSVKQIADMGHAAGLTSLELEKLTEPMKSVRGGFVGLGGTQSEGIKKFGEMAAVSEDVRREFKRLGMGDRERNQALADFVSMMNSSGTAFKGQLGSKEGVQKAALQYARHMYVLADVSGLTVEEAKKKYELQMSTLETALYQNKMEQDRIAAQEQYDKATTAEEREAARIKLEKIKKDQEGYKSFNDALMQARLAPEQVAAAQRQYFTGYTDKTSAQFAQWGVDLDSMIAKAKRNELDPGAAAQEIKTGFRNTINNLGQTTAALDQETAKNMGLGVDMIRATTQQATTDYKDEFGKAVGKIAANEAGEGPAGTDPAQEARNDLIEAERGLKIKVDQFAMDLNPLLGNTGLLKGLGMAVAGAAAVLLVIGSFKVLKSGASAVKKLVTRKPKVVTKASTTAATKALSPTTSKPTAAPGMMTEIDKDASASSGIAKTEEQVVKGIQIASEPKSSMAAKFLFFVTEGLAGFGSIAVPMLVGSAKLSAAILAVGAAIAAANVIVGKVTLPYLAKGMSRFENLDGPKIQILGTAAARLGMAFALSTGGNFMAALDFFGGIEDGEEAIDNINKQVIELQELKINQEKVDNNLAALTAFADAMLTGTEASVQRATRDLVNNAVEGISSFFGATPPYEQFIKFGELDIDVKKTKNNAKAYKMFARAIAMFNGTGSSLGIIGSAIAESTAKFFDVKPPIDMLVYFSNLKINASRTKNNAAAFKMFSEAMSSYKGIGSGLGAISSAISTAIFKHFKAKPPVDQFASFANLNINEKKVESDADAFMKFVNAMASYTPGPGVLDSISNLITGGASYFNKGGPVYKFEEFSKKNFVKKGSKTGEIDQGLLSQYVTSVGTEAFVGESPIAEPVDNAIQAGKDAASSVFGKLADAASSAWSTAKGVWDTAKIHAVIKFTGQSGQYENFIALNPPMQEAVLAAGVEYLKTTGSRLQMNSGRRKLEDQQRLYDTSVRNGTPGRQPNGRLVAKPNPNAPHIKGNAIDLQQGISDTARTNQILAKYKLKNKYGARDLPHYDLYAKDGGVFTGPGSGYPVELHGTEIVVPVDTDSLLMRLSQMPEEELETSTLDQLLTSGQIENRNMALYDQILSQLEQVYSIVDNTYDLDKKMLKQELY